MSKKQSSKGSSNQSSAFSVKVVESSTAFVEKAAAPFQGVERLSSLDKQRLLKLKRGARDVVPTLVTLASKYGVNLPGISLDGMTLKIESARNLEPLVTAVGVLYDTIRDSQLADEGDAWKSAIAIYAVLSATAKANKTLAGELEPVKSWFRSVVRRRSTATKGAPAPAAPDAPAAKVVPPQ